MFHVLWHFHDVKKYLDIELMLNIWKLSLILTIQKIKQQGPDLTLEKKVPLPFFAVYECEKLQFSP